MTYTKGRYTGRMVALTLAGGMLLGGGASLALAHALEPASEVRLLPCQTEDSVDCYWLADQMGNGTGHSFIDLNGTFYVEQTPYADR